MLSMSEEMDVSLNNNYIAHGGGGGGNVLIHNLWTYRWPQSHIRQSKATLC